MPDSHADPIDVTRLVGELVANGLLKHLKVFRSCSADYGLFPGISAADVIGRADVEGSAFLRYAWPAARFLESDILIDLRGDVSPAPTNIHEYFVSGRELQPLFDGGGMVPASAKRLIAVIDPWLNPNDPKQWSKGVQCLESVLDNRCMRLLACRSHPTLLLVSDRSRPNGRDRLEQVRKSLKGVSTSKGEVG